jgi:outer membrane protein assembly factor BamB
MAFTRFYRLVLLSALCVLVLFVAVPGAAASATQQGVLPHSCPTITSFTPTSGAPGTSVTINGCGFTGATAVTFNSVSATFNVNSGTQITATVPTGATSGKIAVTTPTITVKSPGNFIVTPALVLSPTIGPPTSTITVNGTGFGDNEAVDVYFDLTDEALATTNAQGAFSGISIQVPANAVPGTHWVTGVGRHSGLSAQTTFTVQTNWTEFGDIPRHSGTNPYENVLSPANASNLNVDWSAATSESIFSSPAVANGVVYIGSQDGSLYAFNAQTGAQLWSSATGNSIGSTPAVANSVVYVGSNDGSLYAFNAQTGVKLWSAATGNGIYSSPAVANGVVYVGSEDNSLFAFNAQTGTQLWSAATGGSIFSSPAVANGVVYIGSNDKSLYAFNAQTGTQLWSAATGSNILSSPAVANGVVYVGSDDKSLYAFNARSGVKLWSAATGSSIDTAPAVTNGVVYVGSEDHNLYAFNARTGAQLWSAATGNSVESSPAVANGVVYVGSDDANLYAFNAQTGTQLWSATTGGFIYSSPAVANGVVYTGSQDGSLYAYSLSPNDQLKPPAKPIPASLHPNLSLRPVG